LRIIGLGEPAGEVADPAHPAWLPPADRGARITFTNVTFGYGEHRVLDDVSIDVQPGETLAIVGRTGGGKSTLVSMVPRFFDPWSGSVSIDGVDLRSVAVRDVRRRVAFVHQDPFLLPLSIRDNISYGSDGHDLAQVRDAASQALAAEFIDQLPDGYDTVIGERGVTLSGGQRQRLSIARAIYRAAPILVLDEPTAALDAGSEMALLELLREAAAGRTILMVAHRMSTVQSADRIVVLDQGRVVEHGTHRELVDCHGIYASYLTNAGVDARTGNDMADQPDVGGGTPWPRS
jgi:ATP-binding cassette, subfamily B, bacterial